MQTGIRPITSMLTQPDDGRSSMSLEDGNRGSLRLPAGLRGKKRKKTMSYALLFAGQIRGNVATMFQTMFEVPRGTIRDEADAI